MRSEPPVPPEDAPQAVTDGHSTDATHRRLAVAQWVVPALTGVLVVMSARMGEQQRRESVVRDVVRRVRSQDWPDLPRV